MNEKRLAWLLLISLSLIWGSSFILMKRALQVFSPQEVGTLRIFSAAIFLLPLSLPQLKKLPFRYYKHLLLVGLFSSLFPALLFANAQRHLDSALIGALNAVTPFFTLLVGWVGFQRRISQREVLGSVLGLAGTLLLIFVGHASVWTLNYYVLLPLLACLCYGINGNLIKHYLGDLDTNVITSVAFLLVGTIAAIMLFTQTTFLVKLQTAENAYWAMGYVLVQGAFCSAVAYLLFTNLVKSTSALFASMAAFFIPLVALAWGLLDGEVLLWNHYAGIGTILFGVYMINKS
jgi:drug/metabolite transporter (DMT)-like permease